MLQERALEERVPLPAVAGRQAPLRAVPGNSGRVPRTLE